MAFLPRPAVRRRSDGRYDIALDDGERRVLRHFLEQLRDLLLSDDPLLRRLFPPAYLDDPKLEDDYQQLMKGDLIESRFAAIEEMESTLGETTVDEATLTRWMQTVNALRLVVGTRLDVSEDEQEIHPDDPDFEMHVLYHQLGWVLQHIVHALSAGLPPPTVEP